MAEENKTLDELKNDLNKEVKEVLEKHLGKDFSLKVSDDKTVRVSEVDEWFKNPDGTNHVVKQIEPLLNNAKGAGNKEMALRKLLEKAHGVRMTEMLEVAKEKADRDIQPESQNGKGFADSVSPSSLKLPNNPEDLRKHKEDWKQHIRDLDNGTVEKSKG